MNTTGQWPVLTPKDEFNDFILFLKPTLRRRFQAWCRQKSGVQNAALGVWKRFWDEELSKNYQTATVLAESRKSEIMASWPQDIIRTIHAKDKALKIAEKTWSGLLMGVQADMLKNQAAWYSVNETSSPLQYRFQIGFRNCGCRYWRKSPVKLGCLNCGYFFETTCGFRNIDAENFLAQFDSAFSKISLDIKSGAEPAFDVIEFLSDGSFLNNEEIPDKVRRQLFRRINSDNRITKVLIETRPEYLKQDKIISLLNELKRGQQLEIAMGLECTDAFVLDFCINKGYGLKEVYKAAELLSEINHNNGRRCSLLLYLLLKPAYLNENEALEAILRAGRDLIEVAKQTNVAIIMKLEPVVVPQGTILETLSKIESGGKNFYTPPSYWTVLEALARFSEEGIGGALRIGAREDMDRYFEIPAAYYLKGSKKGMLSRYDFLLYEAVQEFNIHHDFVRILVPLANIFQDPSFEDWKAEIGIEEPTFMKFFKQRHQEIELTRERQKNYYDKKDHFSMELASALTKIEYGQRFHELAHIYSNSKNDSILEQLTHEIKELLHKELHISRKHIKINDKFIALIHNELRILRMHIKIVVKHADFQDVRSIWIGIPSRKHISWNEEK